MHCAGGAPHRRDSRPPRLQARPAPAVGAGGAGAAAESPSFASASWLRQWLQRDGRAVGRGRARIPFPFPGGEQPRPDVLPPSHFREAAGSSCAASSPSSSPQGTFLLAFGHAWRQSRTFTLPLKKQTPQISHPLRAKKTPHDRLQTRACRGSAGSHGPERRRRGPMTSLPTPGCHGNNGRTPARPL